MFKFLDLSKCRNKADIIKQIDNILNDKDVFLELDTQGGINYHYLKSAFSPYHKDEFFYVGYFTLKKVPEITFWNEEQEPMS